LADADADEDADEDAEFPCEELTQTQLCLVLEGVYPYLRHHLYHSHGHKHQA
jgi:hypothetical protein